MRVVILFLMLIVATNLVLGQVDYSNISVDYGEYQVAFYDTTMIDHTRSYSSLDQLTSKASRPIHISVWHPVKEIQAKERLKVEDYLQVLAKEEEWPNLPFSYFFDWFYIRNTEVNKRNSDYQVQAFLSRECSDSAKPIIIYSASYQASSVENFILAEYYTSHGYTFIAVPSRGSKSSRLQSSNVNDAYAQSRDIDFVIQNLHELGIAGERKIYLSGFSFGGLSHIINGFKNIKVGGIISFDGTIKYHPEIVKASFECDAENFRIPFIHFSQKDIPIAILEREGTDTLINDKFEFYDQSSSSIKYQLKSKILTHTYFSSFGLLFNELDEEQDDSYASVSTAHSNLLKTSLFFLQELDKYNASGKWEHDELTAKIDSNLFSIVDHSIQLNSDKDIYHLLELTEKDEYSNLEDSYHELVSQGTQFHLPEGLLNTIGLQLIFSPETYRKGINIYKFALSLYPESANLHDSLAEGYLFQGDKTKALLHFEKSLKLYPENTNATKRINEIKKG